MKRSKWSNVPFVWSRELYRDNSIGGWAWADNDRPVPRDLCRWLDDQSADDSDCPLCRAMSRYDWGEVVLHCRSTGYYDPGRTYGDPYYCYPPEGDDERSLEYGELWFHPDDRTDKVRLPQDLASSLFNEHEGAIAEVELESDEY